MLHGEKSYTSSGNMRAPSMEVYLQWIVDAWAKLPATLIIKSFKGCGLTNALDGTEDHCIHCFKPEGSIPSGSSLLRETREKMENEKMIGLFEEIDLEEEDKNDFYDSDDSLEF